MRKLKMIVQEIVQQIIDEPGNLEYDRCVTLLNDATEDLFVAHGNDDIPLSRQLLINAARYAIRAIHVMDST